MIEKNELSFDGLPTDMRQRGRQPPDNLAENSDVVARGDWFVMGQDLMPT